MAQRGGRSGFALSRFRSAAQALRCRAGPARAVSHRPAGLAFRLPAALRPALARDGSPVLHDLGSSPARMDPRGRLLSQAGRGDGRLGPPGGIRVAGEDRRQRAVARDLLSRHKIDLNRYAVVIPGSAQTSKCWPVERFAALVDRLASEHRFGRRRYRRQSRKRHDRDDSEPGQASAGQSGEPDSPARVGRGAARARSWS